MKLLKSFLFAYYLVLPFQLNGDVILKSQTFETKKGGKYLTISAYNEADKKIGHMTLSLNSLPTVHVDGIQVNPEDQGKGAGRILMSSIDQWLPETNVITLNANQSAIPFYEKLGLERYLKSPQCLKWTKEARAKEMAKLTFERIDENTMHVSKR